MSTSPSADSSSRLGRAVDWVEETLIALILGAMTLITFANVIARYVFNDNILWALEATVFLFAWLVLLGASHLVRTGSHLGVDVIVARLPRGARRVCTWLALGCCLAFAGLLFVGSWNYWAPFAGLPVMTGNQPFSQIWYEVNSVPMPAFLEEWGRSINEGEAYEKMPRFIPYAILPLASFLLLLRFVEAAWRLATGRIDLLIASHEMEAAAQTPSAIGDVPAAQRS